MSTDRRTEPITIVPFDERRGTMKVCLLKTGACLIHVHFNVFACFTNLIRVCLIHVPCLIAVAT